MYDSSSALCKKIFVALEEQKITQNEFILLQAYTETFTSVAQWQVSDCNSSLK